MGLRPLEIFLLFQCWDRLIMSESDVYRRQILTYKVPALKGSRNKYDINTNDNLCKTGLPVDLATAPTIIAGKEHIMANTAVR